jgi:hypothetical protein
MHGEQWLEANLCKQLQWLQAAHINADCEWHTDVHTMQVLIHAKSASGG